MDYLQAVNTRAKLKAEDGNKHLLFAYFLLWGQQPEQVAVHDNASYDHTLISRQAMDGNKYCLVLQLTLLLLICIPQTLEMLLLYGSDASFCQSTDCIHVYRPVQLKVMLYKSSIKCISTKHKIYVFCVMKMAIRGMQHQKYPSIVQQVCGNTSFCYNLSCNETGCKRLCLIYVSSTPGLIDLLHFKVQASRMISAQYYLSLLLALCSGKMTHLLQIYSLYASHTSLRMCMFMFNK